MRDLKRIKKYLHLNLNLNLNLKINLNLFSNFIFATLGGMILFHSPAQAGDIDKMIYGDDNRVDVENSSSPFFRDWARSTAAMRYRSPRLSWSWNPMRRAFCERPFGSSAGICTSAPLPDSVGSSADRRPRRLTRLLHFVQLLLDHRLHRIETPPFRIDRMERGFEL